MIGILALSFLNLINAIDEQSPSPIKQSDAIVHRQGSKVIMEYDFMNVFPKSPVERINNFQSENVLSDVPRNGRKRKFSSEQERKDAKRETDNKTRQKQIREYKSLCDGHERKKAKLEQYRKYNNARQKEMESLPEDSEKKQRYRTSRHLAHKNWKMKKVVENPRYFADMARKGRERVKLAKQMQKDKQVDGDRPSNKPGP